MNYISNQDSKKSKKKPVIVTIIVLVIISAALFGGYYYFTDMSLSAKHKVSLSIQFAGYNSSDFTRIPVEVKGTDLKDEKVDELFYVTPDNTDVELAAGKYSLKFPASPLDSLGVLYKTPNGTDFSIPDTLKPEDEFFGISNNKFVFDLLEATEYTDTLINTAVRYAYNDPNPSPKVEEYKKILLDNKSKLAAAEQTVKKQAEIEKAKTEGRAFTGTVKIDTSGSVQTAYLIVEPTVKVDKQTVHYLGLASNDEVKKWTQYNGKKVTVMADKKVVSSQTKSMWDSYLANATVVEEF